MLKQLLVNGLWRNNVARVQLLGLCPLLAVSNTMENAVGIAAASAFVLVCSAFLVSLCRRVIPADVRLPTFMLVIATFTTVVTLVTEALAYDLYLKVALYIQIIVTNCMILGRMEQFASRNSVFRATVDAFATAMGFAVMLLLLGTTRELLSQVLPIAADPTGAFILYGLLLAGFQYFEREQGQARPDLRDVATQQSGTHH